MLFLSAYVYVYAYIMEPCNNLTCYTCNTVW